jgi:hypothetical protein
LIAHQLTIKELSSADGVATGSATCVAGCPAATVWWSHRLSSVRHADRIRRDHLPPLSTSRARTQLMARNGRYAETFTLQAAYFGEMNLSGLAFAV